jgi:Flp pilus assembly pilin Flp
MISARAEHERKESTMRNSHLSKLLSSTRGAGFVEYIILVGLVALFCIAAYQAFGDAVTQKVNEQAEEVTGIGNN